MNKSLMKCCICNNEKQGEFITIDNEKYHLTCIKQLKENWNKLREFFLEEGFEINTKEYGLIDVIDKNVILEKMPELEQGSIIMDNDTLGDYWRDVKPILKQQAQEKRENCFNDRLEYARKKFFENNIPFKLCNVSNGHFNLYWDKKVIMSFWSYTGKVYIPSTGFSDNVGIYGCIKRYKKMIGRNNVKNFKGDSNE